MFTKGDIVEITAEAAATGMLDFKDGVGYRVRDFRVTPCGVFQVFMRNEGFQYDWYAERHFKLKENAGADAVLEFGVGDTVEIVESSYDTGMMDFVLGKGYEVLDAGTTTVCIADESGKAGWYHHTHFNLKEEDTEVEKKECLFKVGQPVWDVRKGRGVVEEINFALDYPISVVFVSGSYSTYTEDGKYEKADVKPSLYFSEPKIEAATEPVFEPILEAGMTLAAVNKQSSCFYMIVVSEETEEVVKSVHRLVFEKEKYDFYRLGEKINFK